MIAAAGGFMSSEAKHIAARQIIMAWIAVAESWVAKDMVNDQVLSDLIDTAIHIIVKTLNGFEQAKKVVV